VFDTPAQDAAARTDPTDAAEEPATPAHLEDGDPEPVEVPEPPTTGDDGVDQALQRMAVAMQQGLPDQVVAYEAVHRALQDRLADVED
jgi:hypothetical protein